MSKRIRFGDWSKKYEGQLLPGEMAKARRSGIDVKAQCASCGAIVDEGDRECWHCDSRAIRPVPQTPLGKRKTIRGAKVKPKRYLGLAAVKRAKPEKKAKSPSFRTWPKGAMHRALKVPAGKKIPTAKLMVAAKGSGEIAKRARFLLHLRGVKTGSMRKMSLKEAREWNAILERLGKQF